MDYAQELAVALAAVTKAAALCRSVQEKLVTPETVIKKDKSPVTVADLGSQALICLELMKNFSNDQVVAEEDVETLSDNPALGHTVQKLAAEQVPQISHADIVRAISHGGRQTDFTKRYWAIDPIDGTKGFLRREQYAIALALVDGGKVALGVLGCPNYTVNTGGDSSSGAIFYAVNGHGARVRSLQTGKERSIAPDGIIEGSRAKFCESVESAHASHEDHAEISRILGITAPPMRLDSQAKYAAVSCGDASIYLRLPRSSTYREKIWDHAAGACIVEQAGGRVTDFSGNALDFTCGRRLEKNQGILSTNGVIHKKVLQAITSRNR